MEEKPFPKKCTKCGKRFKPGDKFFYDMLDDDPSLDDRCEACAEDITFMAYSMIPETSEAKPDGRED